MQPIAAAPTSIPAGSRARRARASHGTILLVLAVFVLLTAGCASRELGCEPERRACPPESAHTFGGCTPLPRACAKVPPGATHRLVSIGSTPTPAAIFVDGEFVGITPVDHNLWFTSTTHFVTVTAEPLYPVQTAQEKRIRVPPLPERITFHMNNPGVRNDPEWQAQVKGQLDSER